MILAQIFKFIKDNVSMILFLVCIILVSLWVSQCQKTAELRAENEATVNIANQNLEALVGDQATQLKLTREQLKKVDNHISSLVDSIEVLKGIKGQTNEVVVTKIEYVPKEVKIPNTLIIDSERERYGLAFTDDDSVRTINGVSWFKVVDTENGETSIVPDSTDVNDFKFNFDLVISEYVDDETGMTKYDITPYYIKPDNTLGGAISENLLKLNYRGVELIKEPWSPNLSDDVTQNPQRRSGWAISFSPISAGFMTNGDQTMLGVGPTVGISYVWHFKK